MKSGISYMLAATFVFSLQDALSRHLADAYGVLFVVMIRYWFFALFVIVLAARQAGGVRAAAATTRPGLQIARGLLLAGEICVMVTGFVLLGLVASHAIFACYPLIIAALSGPFLGERADGRRWAAIGVGFLGVLIILRPGFQVFQPAASVPLIAAAMFALYGILTRLAARHDPPAVSFFWTGVAGAIAITAVGIWHIEPMARADWGWMAALCLTGASGHWLLIRAYDLSEAAEVQPFAYFQLVFASAIGVLILGETVEWPILLGAFLIVGAGLWSSLNGPSSARTTGGE